MSLEVERELTSEQEPKPKVFVAFYGFAHDSLNIQAIGQIRTFLRNNLEKSHGRRIVFLEKAGGNQSDTEFKKEAIKQLGGYSKYLVCVLLTEKLRRLPTITEIDSYIQHLSLLDLDSIIDGGLLPPYLILRYFESLALDELQDELGFEYEFEQHSKSTVKSYKKATRKVHKFESLSSAHWQNGQFILALEECKNVFHYLNLHAQLRDDETIPFLAGKLEILTREKEGGALCILMGTAHLPMTDSLRRVFGDSPSFSFASNPLPYRPPEVVIAHSLNNGQNVSDTIYAQAMLGITIQEHIRSLCYKKRQLTSLAVNYESVLATVVNITNSFSFDQICEICERKVDIWEFLRSHPPAAPIKPYIS